MNLDWTDPHFLWLLAVPTILVPLAFRHSLADWTPRQRWLCGVVRATGLGLVVCALAGPHLRRTTGDVEVFFVVDASASISSGAGSQAAEYVNLAIASRKKEDSAGVIGFATNAMLWNAPDGKPPPTAEWPVLEERDATNIPRALELASAAIGAGRTGRVVLLSDGFDTSGEAEQSAATLRASGIAVDTVPLRNPDVPETMIESVDTPSRPRSGESIDIAVRVRSNRAGPGRLRLYRDRYLVEEQTVSLADGSTRVVFRNQKMPGNFSIFDVELDTENDTRRENNSARAAVAGSGEPRVLLVDPDPEKLEPLAEVLRDEKMRVEIRPPAGIPATLEAWQTFDLVVWSDVPAHEAGAARMELARRWVRDSGGGFLMLGGENSFGAGGYFRTPVEDLLPVRMEHEDRRETPVVALLVVLDRSGSMAAQTASGQTKMSLANQGAVLAMNVLKPRDLFGLFAVDTRVHRVADLTPSGERRALEERILGVAPAGGGIYIHTALAEAAQALRGADARIKHVILFSDAADAEEKAAGDTGDGSDGGGSALDLAATMLGERITTSVVALGLETDRDTAFLKILAERGGGRFYLTGDAMNLPEIFTMETMKAAQSSLVEIPFLAVPQGVSPWTVGIDWVGAPPLLGCNSVKPRAGADIPLATEFGEPLLAVWQSGLGRAAAFTGDAKARWAAAWMEWPGYGKFWARLVRGMLRREDAAPVELRREERGDRLAITLEALTADGAFRNQLPATLLSTTPSGDRRTIAMEQTAPGRYETSLPLPQEEVSTIALSFGDESQRDGLRFAHARRMPSEFRGIGLDENALRKIAEAGGGRFNPAPADVFRRETTATRRQDLTPWLLAGALLLLPIDLWLRRRAFQTGA